MRKHNYITTILLLCCIVIALGKNSVSQEVVADFKEGSLPVINEELRNLFSDIEELEDDIDTDIAAINSFPSGGIIMWSGTIATIPSGWVLCDGNNGTPDLEDRFILHADYDSGGSGTIEQGTSGGSRTISSSQIPAHTHPLSYTVHNYVGSGGAGESTWSAGDKGPNELTADNNVGGGNDYLPKYYALAFIMKT